MSLVLKDAPVGKTQRDDDHIHAISRNYSLKEVFTFYTLIIPQFRRLSRDFGAKSEKPEDAALQILITKSA